MALEPTSGVQEHKDFFISYTGNDRAWAEWIAMQLEQANYTTIIQAWDFRPGSNFVAKMDDAAKRAERTLLVLSSAYLDSDYAFAEWAAAFRHDPLGKQGRVLPVRIERCEVEGLLGPIVYIDLVGLDEQQAREQLLAGVALERIKPATVPFPALQLVRGPQVPMFPGSLPPIWNVPFLRNMLFTGRDDLLDRLAANLRTGQPAALSQTQAISGLGGIGKTQAAIEYAYRHRQDYQAVLWARAENREAVISAYVAIAELLDLPEKDVQEHQLVVNAVKAWMKKHTQWLLILDNADDLTIIPEFLPPTCGGHILLTTRAQAMGRLAQRIEVATLSPEVGALFLLRRAALLTPDASLDQVGPRDREIAVYITSELDGLPLALDQAGAYIEETGCGLADYQQLYQQRRSQLLMERRGLVADHPDSVATTVSLAARKVEQTQPAAAELLRLCAFLAPDAIGEEIITQGAAHLIPLLGPTAADAFFMNQVIEVLRASSLVQRDPRNRALSIHRLVQAVVKDEMDEQTQCQWAELAVRAVDAAFPEVEVATWPRCQRLLAHAQVCAALIDQYNFSFAEARQMLYKAGYYLEIHAQYTQAEPLLRRLLEIREQVLGRLHPDTALSLDHLAWVYWRQGRFEEAERLYQQALEIREQVLEPTHPDMAQSFSVLAGVYSDQGKYEQVEQLHQRALEIREQVLGPTHPSTAVALRNLGWFYRLQGRYKEAELLFQRSLKINEQVLRPTHLNVSDDLFALGSLYNKQGEYEKAEPLLRRALEIREKMLGSTHSDIAQSLLALGWLYRNQRKYKKAEPLLHRALEICEQVLGPIHPDTAQSLFRLGSIYSDQGRYELAQPLYQRALSIFEKQLGLRHPRTLAVRSDYASLLYTMGRDAEAAQLEASPNTPSVNSEAE